LNKWGLGGSWNVGAEHATLESAPGKIVFRFHSRDFHMVLGPSRNGTPVRFKVKLNGVAPGDDHGSDSAADGTGEVRQPRMYQLIRQKGPIMDTTLEIEFLDPGIEAFSFTSVNNLFGEETRNEKERFDRCGVSPSSNWTCPGGPRRVISEGARRARIF
jgi:hypothetical protein